MIDFVGAITGLHRLENDPEYCRAGLFVTPPGGWQRVHEDFRVHPATHLWNRVIMLLYCSEWTPRWGGELELWPPDMSEVGRRIEPRPGRLVLFETTRSHRHGIRALAPDANPRDRAREPAVLDRAATRGAEPASAHVVAPPEPSAAETCFPPCRKSCASSAPVRDTVPTRRCRCASRSAATRAVAATASAAGRERPAQVVALRDVAAERGERVPRDRGPRRLRRRRAGRGCDRGRRSTARSFVFASSAVIAEHERLVDLDLVHREPLQVRRATSSRCRSRRSRAAMPSAASRSSTAIVRRGSAIICVSVISSVRLRSGRRRRRGSIAVDSLRRGRGRCRLRDRQVHRRPCSVDADRRATPRHLLERAVEHERRSSTR